MSKTYYEVLGVPRNAGELEIKAAYHRLARKYHPDKAASPAEATSMEKEFSEISTAYNVLKDKEKRTAYDQSLELKRQKETTSSAAMPKASSNSASAAVSGSGPNASAINEKNRATVAKRAYLKGLQLLTGGDLFKACEFFEVAIKNNEEEALFHAKLAQTLLRSQRSFSRATEAAARAIELDPYNSDYRLILAELYENAGSLSMAIKTFEDILKWDPANEKAKMALSVLAPKKQSFLNRLLGKNK